MAETAASDDAAGKQKQYPPAVWRLIIEREPRTGAENMALDEAIMDAVAAGEALPTLRFYAWEPPCLSLGKRQPLDGVDLDGCRADGVDVVRRATGGFAILHTDDATRRRSTSGPRTASSTG